MLSIRFSLSLPYKLWELCQGLSLVCAITWTSNLTSKIINISQYDGQTLSWIVFYSFTPNANSRSIAKTRTLNKGVSKFISKKKSRICIISVVIFFSHSNYLTLKWSRGSIWTQHLVVARQRKNAKFFLSLCCSM